MALPQQLDQVPKQQHLPVAQGFGFGGIGLGALVVFVPYAIHAAQHGLKGNDWKYLLGAAVAAAGGIAIELLRRRKPRILVPQGREVGVYEDGQLVRTFTTNQLTVYQLSFLNTFRELGLFGMIGLSATLVAFGTLGKLGLYSAWVWGAAIAFNSLAYSSFLTRVVSRQYYLPGENAPVAFSKSALQRVGWNH